MKDATTTTLTDRDGPDVTIETTAKKAVVTVDGQLPAGPSDWKDWLDRSLNIRFDHDTEVISTEPLEGKIVLHFRGGPRGSLTVYDTKPRSLV